MSNIEDNVTNKNENNSPSIEIKENNDQNIMKLNTLLSNYENEKTRVETLRDNKNKKHVTFTKPVYTLIDVESYKKYNSLNTDVEFSINDEHDYLKEEKADVKCTCFLF